MNFTSRLALAVLAIAAVVGPAAALPQAGETPPDFTAQDQDGLTFRLSEQSGKVTVLHICTVWCAPCRLLAAAHSQIAQELDARLGPDRYQLVDLLVEDNNGLPSDQADAQLWKSAFGTPARVLHMGGDANAPARQIVDYITTPQGTTAFPTNLVIRADGTLSALTEGWAGSVEAFADLVEAAVGDSVPREVGIDIRPGSDENPVNPGAAGAIPVAILSEAGFDAVAEVDPATVLLAGAGVWVRGRATAPSCAAEDANGDGLTDLVCRVDASAVQVLPGDTSAVLEATTYAGQALRGEDVIRVVP